MSVAAQLASGRTRAVPPPSDLALLLDRLNSQLGIILAHAELLQLSASDGAGASRSGQIVTAALEAMGTSREIALHLDRPAVDV